MFSNQNIQSTIEWELNGNSFGYLVGFGIYSSSNTVYYYVMDDGDGKVYILNDDWSFISVKTFTNPAYMISIGSSLYMTGTYNIWKVDQDLNILINYNPTGGDPDYLGLSYNPSNGLIYVVSYGLKEIQVFNMKLTLIRRFSTEPHWPFSITESSNKLYVGTAWSGILLVYKNEKIIKQFNGCNGNNFWVESILFDQNGYMAISCALSQSSKLYLYLPNGSLTGKSIATPDYPYYIGFDSKGRFIQISDKKISIYN